MSESEELPPPPSRVPTKPLVPPLEGEIRISFADGDNAADFLERMARIIRVKGELHVIIK